MRPFFALVAGLLVIPFLLVSQVMAQDGYRIRAGDVLRIEVLEDPSLNRNTLVSPDGRISMPLAGAVRAAGRTVEEVQALLTNQMAPNFAAPPNVYVSIERLRERIARPTQPSAPPTINIYVMGEAAKPGKLSVEPGTTVLQVFAEMGGFTNFAATKRIQLRRTDPETGVQKVYTINYKDIERGKSGSGNSVVSEGDVILVPQRKLFE